MTFEADKPAFGASRLTAEKVIEFLLRRPNFLLDNQHLLQVLTPPETRESDGAVDFQRFMIERLQRELAELKSQQQELVTASQSNMMSQNRIHAAVLALLATDTFEHLVELITTDLAAMLQVDVVTLCLEAAAEHMGVPLNPGVYVVAAGETGEMIGEGREILLRSNAEGEQVVFGAGAGMVLSSALIRLDLAPYGPPALLAMGARDERRFHPGQGTELLGFLAHVVSGCIKGWLERPV
ncbi:MAG TPA: DUF484 family protein [Alphaproteobacteria bacterium]|nr:DUF484 family protein [Alphaproteobacteria bacterium]MDP6270875.1 DUF484 family protein [Alphaproteobacteria bacterium]MDP7429610.1 DUF484 family protein [Alphaproteobacteria bacterium]HJM48830.1 DUF484 family protein [Alphaproteobacteria bacterium]